MRGGQNHREYIGKVIISSDYPARADEFYAWVKLEKGVGSLEIGTWVVAEDPSIDLRYICIVEEIKALSSASILDEYYGSKMGDPQYEPELPPEILYVLKLRVVWNNKKLLIAPPSRLKVRLLTNEEMKQYFASVISDEERILGGFAKTLTEGSENYVPLYFGQSYLLGPEGAHANICGISGLASKTSYALFLAYSIYAWAKRYNKRVAIILFNVKGEDFMYLHKKIENIDEELKKWTNNEALMERIKKMYELFKKEYGYDLIEDIHNKILEEKRIRYFTFEKDPAIKKTNIPEDIIRHYKYALWDLDANLLSAGIFEPEEEREATQQVGFLYSFFGSKDELKEYIPNFKKLCESLSEAIQQKRQEVEFPPYRGDSTHRHYPRRGTGILINRYSAGALYRRITNFLNKTKQGGNIIDEQSSELSSDENSIKGPIGKGKRKFVEGFNVIQLVGLHPAEQRIIVLDALSSIWRELNKKIDERDFDYAVVVIDELNKYAPKSRSPWKHLIIDISARGREKQLSLIGVEQFASGVDPEVIGNCSTFIIGRQNTTEIRHDVYKVFGDFREIAHMLDKGEILMHHPLYPSPIRAYFPIPPAKLISKK